MNVTNIIEVALNGRTFIESPARFQYDYGQKLKITDMDTMGITSPYQVYFSNDFKNGTAEPQMGGLNGVIIPNKLFLTGKPIYAFFFLHSKNDDGRTAYVVKIPVINRAAPSDLTPDDDEQNKQTIVIDADIICTDNGDGNIIITLKEVD